MSTLDPSRAVRAAAALAFVAVALGAFGAHALKESLSTAGMTDVWRTAVFYHLVHSVVLLVLGCRPLDLWSRRVRWGSWCFIVGILCFSGSLYILALGGPSWLGPVTPIGGLLFLMGWGNIFASVSRNSSPSK